MRPPDLPDYEHPPIDEVAIGVQFQRLGAFNQAHIGLIWHEIRDRYPKTQDHPPVISFNPLEGPTVFPMPAGLFRTWLISEDDSMVLQLQPDRLIHNWRRRPGVDYPRFEHLSGTFVEHLARFQRLIGPCELSQIEVTYVNWLPNMEPHRFFRPAKLLKWSDQNMSRHPLNVQWAEQHPVLGDDKSEFGRLVISCASAARPFPPPAATGAQFTLTFAGPLNEASDVPVKADRARSLIVRAFTDLTTPSAQKAWGRIQ